MFNSRGRSVACVQLAFVAAVITLASMGQPAHAAGVTLSETEFADANWNLEPLDAAPEDFATAGQSAGGNPGTYRRTDLRAEDHYYKALNTRTGWVYDPGTKGAITRLDWSVDVLKVGSPPKGYSGIYNLVLIQNGVLFEDHGPNAGVQASQPGWFSWPAFVNRKESHFLNMGSTGPESPDFSAGGAPIYFAIVASGPQSGGTSGIDNLLIKINGGGGGGGGDEGPNLTGEWDEPLVISSQPGRRNTTVYTLEALTVENDGTKPAGAKKKKPKATFYLSDDDVLDGKDLQVGTKSLNPLKPGASKRYVLKFTLPSNINLKKASGKFLIAVLDSAHKVTETDETDNTIAAQIP